ncbi:MAG TPA: hypothetical protein VLR94_03275 [Acidobacteriota bacterium]|nr:hypothetical protein [Acidobacteriota bacterium]
MKKLFVFAIIAVLFGLSACKKKEEQPATQQPSAQQGEFKPAQKKKKDGVQPVVAPLKIYQEQQLVKSVAPAEYTTLTTTKVKVGPKQMDAITLKELLAKNNLKSGKYVTLGGETMSAQITWEQANSADLYIYRTPKNFLKIQAGKSLADIKFPKRLESITVSASQVAAKAPQTKPATNK